MVEPLSPGVASLLGTDVQHGGFLESSSCMLALKKLWHWPSGDKKQQAAHKNRMCALVHEGSQMRPSCLFSVDTCGDLLVTLQSLSRQGDKRSLQLSGKVNSMTFTFDNVLPGKYKSKILSQPLMALTCPHGLLSKRSKTQLPNSSQMYTITCLALLWPVTLNALYLTEALGTSCHHISIAHTLLCWEGALIHAILLLNAEKASAKW